MHASSWTYRSSYRYQTTYSYISISIHDNVDHLITYISIPDNVNYLISDLSFEAINRCSSNIINKPKNCPLFTNQLIRCHCRFRSSVAALIFLPLYSTAAALCWKEIERFQRRPAATEVHPSNICLLQTPAFINLQKLEKKFTANYSN